MLKWILSFAGLVVIAGVVFTLKYGVAPKPIPLIKATEFDSPEQVGVLVYRRLLQDLRQEPIVVVGSLPSLSIYKEVWDGFLLAAQDDGHPFEKVYFSDGLQTPMPLKEISLEPWRGQALDQGQKILIYGPTNWSSHFFEASLVKKLEAVINRPIFSLTLKEFVVTKDQLGSLQPPCPENKAKELSYSEQLTCASVRVSKEHFRKKLNEKKSWMALYRFGLKDYILLISTNPRPE